MNSPAYKKMTIARSRLLLDHPFFGVLALRLQLVEDEACRTMATDGRCVYFNPDFVNKRPMTQTSAIIAHEVMHCILEHNDRGESRIPARWREACDYAVNQILMDAGINCGPDQLISEEFRGMSADQIYNCLVSNKGDGGEDESLDDLLTHKSLPPDVTVEQIRTEWKLAVVATGRMIQGQGGDTPNFVKKMLVDLAVPVIDWRTQLAEYATEKMRDDYSFRRPNFFFADSGFYLPSLNSTGLGEIVVGLDTSGSVYAILNQFLGVLNGIIDTAQPRRVHVLQCDSRVRQVDVFEQGAHAVLEAAGGGGTDFRPVFDYVTEHNINPACLIYVTDMYGTFPDTPPGYPTIWCSTSQNKVGPFGDTIYVTP